MRVKTIYVSQHEFQFQPEQRVARPSDLDRQEISRTTAAHFKIFGHLSWQIDKWTSAQIIWTDILDAPLGSVPNEPTCPVRSVKFSDMQHDLGIPFFLLFAVQQRRFKKVPELPANKTHLFVSENNLKSWGVSFWGSFWIDFVPNWKVERKKEGVHLSSATWVTAVKPKSSCFERWCNAHVTKRSNEFSLESSPSNEPQIVRCLFTFVQHKITRGLKRSLAENNWVSALKTAQGNVWQESPVYASLTSFVCFCFVVWHEPPIINPEHVSCFSPWSLCAALDLLPSSSLAVVSSVWRVLRILPQLLAQQECRRRRPETENWLQWRQSSD